MSNNEQFPGFEHNAYQNSMHGWAHFSLWTIIILGVAFGAFGFFWGMSN